MITMLLASAWGTFLYWVAVSVVAGILLALILGGGTWLSRRVRQRRQRPKADPPDIDLDTLGQRQRACVQALLREREGYVKRGLKDRVEQVDAHIIKARGEWWENAQHLRIALTDIRSELESARRILREASEQQLFWNPELEQVPGQRWDDHRQTLAGVPEVEETRAAIEDAYQRCNGLNQLVLRRVDEDRREREADPRLFMRREANWGRSFDAMEHDRELVSAAFGAIDKATASIDASLESLAY